MLGFITSLRSSLGERSGELPPRSSSSFLEPDIHLTSFLFALCCSWFGTCMVALPISSYLYIRQHERTCVTQSDGDTRQPTVTNAGVLCRVVSFRPATLAAFWSAGPVTRSHRTSRRLDHRRDCRKRIPFQPVVDEDKCPALRSRCLSFGSQRPARGLRSQTSFRLRGAVI